MTVSTPDTPLVSVVTVNYNGERHLEGLLDALLAQSWPRFEVLLVDNASTDGSVTLVEQRYPAVRVLRSQENLGFTGGNNLGIAESRGEMVALINNDTVPDPDWLLHLVETALGEPKVGGVGSKILFARPFVPVTVSVAGYRVEGDGRRLGVFVSERSGFAGCAYRKRIFGPGFHGPERLGGEAGRWSEESGTLFLPVETAGGEQRLDLRLWGGERAPASRRLLVHVGEQELAVFEVGQGWSSESVSLPAALVERHAVDVVNNAASFLEPDGRAGDRGIFEPDRGQWDAAEEVTSLCGCSMLLSKAALDEVGAFDPDYFMYFEDTELSWRLREAGYRLRYQPASVLRHFHASASVEWSPLFNFLVGRNRVLMLLRHARLRHALRAWAAEAWRLVRLMRAHRSLRHTDVRTRWRLQASLLAKGPRALLKRFGWLRDASTGR